MTRSHPYNPESYNRHFAAKLSYGKRFERRADMGNFVPKHPKPYRAREDKGLKRFLGLPWSGVQWARWEDRVLIPLVDEFRAKLEAQIEFEKTARPVLTPAEAAAIELTLWRTIAPALPAPRIAGLLPAGEAIKVDLPAQARIKVLPQALIAPLDDKPLSGNIPLDKAAKLCNVDLDVSRRPGAPALIGNLLKPVPLPKLDPLPCHHCGEARDRHLARPLQKGGGVLCQRCAAELGLCECRQCRPGPRIPRPVDAPLSDLAEV